MRETLREENGARPRFPAGAAALILILALLLTLAWIRRIGSAASDGTLDGVSSPACDVKSLYANSADAVFYLRALNADGELKTAGSGFAIDPRGLALTAAHVVQKGELIHAVLASGEEIEDISVLYQDDNLDIALLRLPEVERDYAFLSLEEEAPLSGEAAYAIGYPLKPVKLIADGIIASPDSEINGTARMIITTDLASGMSGGPILCSRGTVIGLSSATLRTMNGFSVSPTTAQLWQAAAPYWETFAETEEPPLTPPTPP